MDFIAIGKEVLKTEVQALETCASRLDTSLQEAVECIAKTKGKLIVTGVGKS